MLLFSTCQRSHSCEYELSKPAPAPHQLHPASDHFAVAVTAIGLDPRACIAESGDLLMFSQPHQFAGLHQCICFALRVMVVAPARALMRNATVGERSASSSLRMQTFGHGRLLSMVAESHTFPPLCVWTASLRNEVESTEVARAMPEPPRRFVPRSHALGAQLEVSVRELIFYSGNR